MRRRLLEIARLVEIRGEPKIARKLEILAWDYSVLPRSPRDIAEMDVGEREDFLGRALHRAVDLLQACAAAFPDTLGASRGPVIGAAQTVSQIARRFS
jgi:hypothetical protein